MTTKKIYTVEFRFHVEDTYEIEASDMDEAREIFNERVEKEYPALCAPGSQLEFDAEWSGDEDE